METEKDWFIRQEQDLNIDSVIRGKIKSSVNSDFSSEIFAGMRVQLEKFLSISLQNLNDGPTISSEYTMLLSKLTEISNSRIVRGTKYLEEINKELPIIILSNHFGITPLTLIDNTNQKFPWPLKQIGVFPVRLTSLNLLSKVSRVHLFEVAAELPEPIATIQRATPSILIPINARKRLELLIYKTKRVIQQDKKAGIIIYPEGGMSGKLNNGGPYDLDEFHTGAFALAKRLNLYILPVCQYFNPKFGFELEILKPLNPNYISSTGLNIVSTETQKLMQKSLNNFQENSI